MVQSNQLTTRIPNNLPNSTEIGQQDDNDYPDDREEYLYQVDGTTDDEDTEPDNTHKRHRKMYAPADANRKELTKQRQAQLLKNQQEKERAKAQALEDRDKKDKANRTKPKRPTTQPKDNSKNIDDTNSPSPQSKGKASHPDQIKSSKKGTRKPRAGVNAKVLNDPPLDPDTQDEDILIADQNDPRDDSDYPVVQMN